MQLWERCRVAVLVLLVAKFASALNQQERVAIVGAGVGGSSTAYFLRNSSDAPLSIDIFESGAVGGRAQEAVLDDQVMVELGASMIAGSNHYLRQMVDEVGLTASKQGGGAPDAGPLGIWNGTHFVFIMDDSFWKLALKATWRYHTAPLIYGYASRNTFFENFENIYELQRHGLAFPTPDRLLHITQLYNYTQMSCSVLMKKLFSSSRLNPGALAGQRFADEFVAAINRVNYNQHNANMNAFAGLVSFFPVVDRVPTWRVREGNSALAPRLIQHANATLHAARVTAIRLLTDGTYMLTASRPAADSDGEEEQEFGPYTGVVIAAPLESANISFHGVVLPDLPRQAYQQTISTFVRGLLSPEFFGLRTGGMAVGQVAVTDGAATPFSSISPVKALDGGLYIYKVFSESPLSDDLIHSIFLNATLLTSRTWLAYPKFDPPERFAPFELAPGPYSNNAIENAASALEMPATAENNNSARHIGYNGSMSLTAACMAGLYYNNAIENAASALEMSAIAAKNSALLLTDHIAKLRAGAGCGGQQCPAEPAEQLSNFELEDSLAAAA